MKWDSREQIHGPSSVAIFILMASVRVQKEQRYRERKEGGGDCWRGNK